MIPFSGVAGDVCSPLQYFVDDCNIVNNYADLGADGYKDLFVGACNRHQLCYACVSLAQTPIQSSSYECFEKLRKPSGCCMSMLLC